MNYGRMSKQLIVNFCSTLFVHCFQVSSFDGLSSTTCLHTSYTDYKFLSYRQERQVVRNFRINFETAGMFQMCTFLVLHSSPLTHAIQDINLIYEMPSSYYCSHSSIIIRSYMFDIIFALDTSLHERYFTIEKKFFDVSNLCAPLTTISSDFT